MNRLTCFVISVILLFSCVSEPYLEPTLAETETNSMQYSTLKMSNDEATFLVDSTDVEKYIKFKVLEAQHRGKQLELRGIDPIFAATGKISMYVIEYNKGWDVISADKRLPMVMASSETGEFEYTEDGVHKFYFDMVSEDLQDIIDYENKKLIETRSLSSESYENVEFWDAITASDEFVAQYLQEYVFPRDSLEIIPMGHWELDYVESERETYEEVDHLINYEWGQGYPFNGCCPNRVVIGDHYKAPAGCVAVAGAQTLAYLKEYFDLDIDVPSDIYVSGNTNSHSFEFNYNGPSIWNNLNNDYNASVLIAYIGHLVETDYGDDVSTAYTDSLKTAFIDEFGINCSYEDFSQDIVKASLLNYMPVIVSADPYPTAPIGHCFIIDGFNSYRIKYTYTYEWVYDSPSSKPIESKPSKIEISYSSPLIEKIRMNWGYEEEDFRNNDNEYTLTGNWTISLNGGTESYDYHKRILHGFSITE